MKILTTLFPGILIFTLIFAPFTRASTIQDQQEPPFAHSFEFSQAFSETPLADEYSFSNVTPLTEISIQLLGKGIKDSQQNAMALVCRDLNCSKVQMAFFDHAKKTSFYFGKTYFMNSDGHVPNQQEIKTVVTTIKNQYKEIRKQYGIVPQWILLILGVTAMIGLGILTGSAAVFMGAGLGTAGIIDYNVQPRIHLSMSVEAAGHFDEQNGWNWATDAKKINDKSFHALLDVVQ